ncbi:MAG: NAD-dependent 4,6-dehydratase LegB [Alphaproteobacteria bacterium]|nr:NAD-dependent 4,6-dehydratase LegB [Alphaproteobacteria bacterium]MBU1525457.1 NAD-dependent 4,6-dehydratase LegB [Alphaproteobacteria bacterium]MBU2116717.1 NAD-dependent 4,6-dehydratase LegB [Alphaproteobacteria bacterium]MBU2350859.1 NAD-dependent 4,6-dehydratase LegB [Alphaproteobacteria bacterium]MBU2381760.1 NAD-dependent 4,6-dehydratase LegB [Alphaproteobacteria bacterium]
MDLHGKRILVTGADGFIGSHLVERLVADGHRVRAMVQYNSLGTRGWLDRAGPGALDGVQFVAGDVRDPHGTRDAMRDCEVVLHLAALIAIPYSYSSPDAYVDTNVRGTLNVVQAARELGTERVVVTSTSEVYGTARFVPMTEDHPLQGQSPYSATKIGADQIALSFHAAFGTPVTVIRPFNVYGPRQSARAVIPTVITQIAAGADRIRLGALHPTRDFTFVRDTAAAFPALAACDAAVGQVVNVGSEFEISIGDLAALIAEVMGRKVGIEADDARLRPALSEVERLFSDSSRMRALTGWAPEHAGRDGFARGLEKTVAWFRDPANLAAYRPGEYVL